MVLRLRQFSESQSFQNFIVGVIILNAILMGLETSETLSVGAAGSALGFLSLLTQGIFIAEISIRLGARLPRVQDFFKDGWNIFDFVVVMASLVPAAGTFATVARLARLLRVTRLLSVVPELRLIVTTMLRSLSSMSHILLLIGIVLYIYAIAGHSLFGKTDVESWGTLGRSLLTLFQILTLENWSEIQAKSLTVAPMAWVYYTSFIFFAVFIIVNLFVAVVINNLEEARRELRAEKDSVSANADVLAELGQIQDRLQTVERLLRKNAEPGSRVISMRQESDPVREA